MPDPTLSGANPFTALTFITAPAILTNAASVLAMSTSNRFLRASERIRALAEELTNLAPGTPEEKLVLVQVERIERQALWLLGALRGAYVALGGFAVASLISLLGASLGGFAGLHLVANACLLIALLAGAAGVAALVFACTRLFHATRLSMRNISDEVANIRRLRGGTALASTV